jgi:putative flippase GtrA
VLKIDKTSGEIVRFVVVGVLATAIHYLIYYLLLNGLGHNIAYTTGYGVSFVANYVLSSLFTFRVGMTFRRFVGFGLSHLTNYLLQIVLLNSMIWMGVSELLAPLPVFAIAVPLNFLLVRYALKRLSGPSGDYLLLLLSVGFAMLLLFLLDVPTLSDDIIYHFYWNTDEGAPVRTINNFSDLLGSQLNHYLVTNGRLPVHLLAQTFLVFLPPLVLQIINAILFVLLLHLCACLLTDNVHKRIMVAASVFFLLFVVFQGFRTAILWGLGSFNYLWVLVAILTMLLWMRHTAMDRLSWRNVLLLPLALLAGWSHEAIALPLSAAFALWLLRHIDQLRRPSAMSCAMLAFMIGTALCLLSPGIWSRGTDGVSMTGRMISGAVNLFSNIRVCWLLVLSIVVMWYKCRKELRHHLQAHVYAYVALGVALMIVLLCGSNLERVCFFVDFIAMLLLISLLLPVMPQQWSRRLVVVCGFLTLVSYVPAYMVRNENSETWKLAVQQMREPGRELIAVRQPMHDEWGVANYFRRHYVLNSFDFGYYCSYMGFDANDINMRCAARLYDKEHLFFLPEEVVRRIAHDSAAYNHYELVSDGSLYVWRLPNNRPVAGVRFVLAPEDVSQLLPHQRLLAYRDDVYELDDFRFEMVDVYNHPYLVFTRPMTNIYRRIDHIEIVY